MKRNSATFTSPRTRISMQIPFFANNGEYFLAGKLLGPTDRFLFYYSGHGSPGRGRQGPFTAFLWGATAGLYDPTWDLPVSDISLWSARLPAKYVLFLLDGCGLGLGLPAKSIAGDRIAVISNNGSRIALAATRGEVRIATEPEMEETAFSRQNSLKYCEAVMRTPTRAGFTTIDAISALDAARTC